MNNDSAARTAHLLDELFGSGHGVVVDAPLVSGHAKLDGRDVAVIGTTGQVHIGARIALALAGHVLDVVRDTPGRPIVLIVDNSGQRLSLWDELMGNNGCIAHLTKCLDLARRRQHRVVGLVHELAVSGGFMATGMATEACYALPGAEVRVMATSAMSRVTGIPEEQLQELFRTSATLGPGVDNFVRIGGLHGVLDGDLRASIVEALQQTDPDPDPRRRLGAERGGRTHAAEVAAISRAGREL
ncbi:malonate decarboxylase gamma subunit [Natronocella acetinitrilica]|uniref:Malonate decarboxylase gamma subunit n=1 Tax=Natronocella acetinitrilica TaxID=414046 RepID=A0AAE3KES8_9GAMM|nr:biotin-independent malonate decarboxylase subunit gamma [Natronocella acetinitrilica]MCP1673417.1 malonate decarboxylase gamma subunit [Natronocella acetinitrilica]